MKHLIRLLFALLSIRWTRSAEPSAPDRTFSWGEQLFVVFGRGEVWINSVNNMDDRAAVSSFGCVCRNKLLLQKTIEQAGPGDD